MNTQCSHCGGSNAHHGINNALGVGITGYCKNDPLKPRQCDSCLTKDDNLIAQWFAGPNETKLYTGKYICGLCLSGH